MLSAKTYDEAELTHRCVARSMPYSPPGHQPKVLVGAWIVRSHSNMSFGGSRLNARLTLFSCFRYRPEIPIQMKDDRRKGNAL